MEENRRPGPKPRRIYLRLVRIAAGEPSGAPSKRRLAEFIANLEREGRLVGHGRLIRPFGDLLLVRATDRAEAERALRPDPFREVPEAAYELLEWAPGSVGTNVNLDPAPRRGAGRLTTLQRVAVAVRDQARSVAWYRDVLGLSVRYADVGTGYVELSLGLGGSGIALVQPDPAWGEPHFSEVARRIGTNTGIVFRTDSVAALELRLRHAHALVTQPPERQPWGGATLRFADLDGNEFLAFGDGVGSPAEGPTGVTGPRGDRRRPPAKPPDRSTRRKPL